MDCKLSSLDFRGDRTQLAAPLKQKEFHSAKGTCSTGAAASTEHSLTVSPSFASLIIFVAVLGSTLGFFFRWKQSSTLNSMPMASRDCVQKIDTFLKAGADPDCLLLGSSAFLVPAVYCEEHRLGRSLKAREADFELNKKLLQYDSAPELERQLSARLQKPITVHSLAVAGSNVSDYLLEIEALQKVGRKPKLIVCGLGVRDFVQSFWHMEPSNNPAYKLLKPGAQKPPNLDDHMLNDLREECLSSFFRQPRRLISSTQASLTNNSAVLVLPKTDEQKAAIMMQTLTELPQNAAFIEGQISAYKELLRFCQAHSMPLVIMEVPKRTGWAGVIDDATVQKIKTTIKSECQTYNIPYYNVGSGFSGSDFVDDLHPNETGGIKLFDKMATAIVEHGAL
jgi:hypothetical protein